MAQSLRFERPASNARNSKARRYDVFGPKINRAISIFGQPALLLWTMLEADPGVDAYCERPLVIPETSRAVDFWVRREGSDGFVILLKQSELEEDGSRSLPPKVQSWIDASRTAVILVDPAELMPRKVLLENWGSIIRDLSAFFRYVPVKLTEEVRKATQDTISLGQIEQDFEDQDPVLARVALFSLLHRGLVLCPELEHAPLSSSMMFASA